MKYMCIKCGKTWGQGNEEFFSHGFCKACAKEHLLHLIRKHQLEEGNFDCFGRSTGYCDQWNCKYRNLCL